MNIEYDNYFSGKDDGCDEQPYQMFPKLFLDDRGWFQEVLKGDIARSWIQLNRSRSSPNVVRGCHAQRGKYCQAKLVEAINSILYDFIIDCRPESKTFGKAKIYALDPETQNKLYVPHGFLHGFIVPSEAQQMTYFNYYCDNVYDKASEVCIAPCEVVKDLISNADTLYKRFPEQYANFGKLFNSTNFTYSEKDKNGISLESFLSDVKKEYETSGKVWYR